MRKWLSFTSPLIITFILLSFGFEPKEVKVPETLKVTQPTEVLFPKNKTVNSSILLAPPFLGSSYIGFKEALAFKESQGNYFTTNTLGYLGKYQFGIGTLQLMGVYNATRFLNDPVLQERAFHTNIARNKWILRRDIARFVGKRIGGVEITESGMLAAAHLAGAGNVKKYLRSWGAFDVSDSYGTTIAEYMKKFSGYDISHVSPKRNPKV
ncbi:hypothetical protein Q4603_05075 [Zobellia galactanivorans]|uniref:Conserved hypothetical periplasmic protein n=1 Tax=Zobellia galactanivorans (strain DSM 12802 / CCUG 47099 / CIP 106680 / NCIMB 13871 / Dsij) TaxID=63186 RepID=G0LCU5_ZOBGA|nr:MULTISPECIES: hypothetical protein [Zobellia]MBU3027105.1 hypothetical protein [Zobellia galactanivorans]MDO6517088.1 hypothetical protein [Zobellia uliginosa]MDO6807965.1 hypothetical protein [Zobellia galactanivorans]OWW24865.1 hypothetical protein B4Q04_13470 [Zobellia sp. OII3]CAZ94077.1 Conserved hypothetical periplasmic protein [Zobellia galactanivorans]